MFAIRPYQSVNSLEFGMCKSGVIQVVGNPLSEGPNWRGDVEMYYSEYTLFLSKNDQLLKEIEVYPSDGEVYIDDIKLLDNRRVIKELAERFGNPLKKRENYLFLELGIVLPDPSSCAHEDKSSARTVCAFRKGVFDDLLVGYKEVKIV